MTPVTHDDAHAIVAAFCAQLTGHHVTYHGDDFQVRDVQIMRDSHGWPTHAMLVFADDTRGDSIRAYLPIEATPIRQAVASRSRTSPSRSAWC